ncbi:MAG: helix-turn-helix transcriptional regulator [Pigmentiphaga sp.]
MAERLVRRAEAAGMLSVSTMTLDRMVKDGRMPQPIRLSPRVVGWREQTLLSLLKEREECAAQK